VRRLIGKPAQYSWAMGLYIYFQWLSMILTFLLDLISAFDNPVSREENTLHFIFLLFSCFFYGEDMAWRLFLCPFLSFFVFLWLTSSISHQGTRCGPVIFLYLCQFPGGFPSGVDL
jgi:hypothetical protein